MTYSFDQYTLKARIAPFLLVILPLALTLICVFPTIVSGWNALATVLATFGISALLAQLGRDSGKSKEGQLFKTWGGTPTTILLSHHHTTLEENTLKRYHREAQKRIPNISMPTPEEESKDPIAAYEVYSSIIKYLRENTRDKTKFPLIASENTSYGFRRNLWGLKPAGIGIAAIATALIILAALSFPQTDTAYAAVSLVINLFLLSIWLFIINTNWVRVPAQAYAERLVASLDVSL